MQKKGAALRAVQESEVQEGEKVSPSTRSGRTETGQAGSGPSTPPDQVRGSGGRTEGETLPARLDFTPVPRRYRYDGWTPERQVAFIHALADTGCVDRAARMVNMAQTNCYALKRAPGAESFRRAWDAALDCGLGRMKDIAFERAIEGELIPVFSQGKLMGYRRKRNDALLMFCLRHYGQDANGRRVTVNYFSTRASAGSADSGPLPPGSARTDAPHRAARSAVPRTASHARSPSPSQGGAVAEASTTTVRTVITGPSTGSGQGPERDDAAAAVLNGFEGVQLDAEAEAAIAQALLDCAERARAAEAACEAGGVAAEEAAADDPGEVFFRSADFHGELLPAFGTEAFEPFVEGESHWTLAGAEKPEMLVRFEEEQAAKKREAAKDSGDERI